MINRITLHLQNEDELKGSVDWKDGKFNYAVLHIDDGDIKLFFHNIKDLENLIEACQDLWEEATTQPTIVETVPFNPTEFNEKDRETK